MMSFEENSLVIAFQNNEKRVIAFQNSEKRVIALPEQWKEGNCFARTMKRG